MKKLIIAVVTILVSWSAVSAQVAPYFGELPRVALSASIDIGKPIANHSDFFPGYDTGVGLSVGALYNLPLGGNFFFEPSAEIYLHKWSNGHYFQIHLADISSDFDKLVEADIDYHSLGVTLPVQVGYRMVFEDCGLSLATGLAARLGLHGKAKATTKISGNGEHVITEPLFGDGPFRRTELALPLSVTVDYGRWLFGMRVMLGLNNVRTNNEYNMRAHNRSVAFRVAYGL